jgi:hypothetical protein
MVVLKRKLRKEEEKKSSTEGGDVGQPWRNKNQATKVGEQIQAKRKHYEY